MSRPRTLSSDNMTSIVATAAITIAIVSGAYLLRSQIGGITITLAASMIAFLIGRAFSPLNFAWVPESPTHDRLGRGFHRTAPALHQRPTWLAPAPSRQLADGHFRVEDWQHAECA
jgi:hypothetical protein